MFTQSAPTTVLRYGQNSLLLGVRTKSFCDCAKEDSLLLEYDQYDQSRNFCCTCDVMFNLSADFISSPEEIMLYASAMELVMG